MDGSDANFPDGPDGLTRIYNGHNRRATVKLYGWADFLQVKSFEKHVIEPAAHYDFKGNTDDCFYAHVYGRITCKTKDTQNKLGFLIRSQKTYIWDGDAKEIISVQQHVERFRELNTLEEESDEQDGPSPSMACEDETEESEEGDAASPGGRYAVNASSSLVANPDALMHGWAAGPVLLEFVAKLVAPLSKHAMTVDSLSKEVAVEKELLAIALRTCAVLGYVTFNAASSEYSAAPSQSLDELVAVLAPNTAVADAIRSIYKTALPPFRFPSYQASLCLQVWAQHRSVWQKLGGPLPALLDGIVLTPLVMSLAYFARYDRQGIALSEETDYTTFQLGALNLAAMSVMKEIIEDALQIGKMDDEGVVVMTSKGSDSLKDWCSHYATASFEPCLEAVRNRNTMTHPFLAD